MAEGNNPNRSPRALPQQKVQWLPPTPRPDERADFFSRGNGMSEWRRRERKPPLERTTRAILAYPRAKKRYGV